MPERKAAKSIHPNSLNNLKKRGRRSKEEDWGEPGITYTTSITLTAKNNLLAVVKAAGYKTVPDFLEYVGRGLIEIPDCPLD